jgi:cytochrome b6-f complex iron-sulfur subunit
MASLGILAVQVTGITIYLSMPHFRPGEFGGIIVAGPVSDLPDEDSSPVNYPEGKFWLVGTEAGVIALYKVCTHLDCLVHWDDQEGTFVCPCHGSQFDRDGRYISGPAPRSLDRFVTQVVTPDGTVLAESEPQTGKPLPLPTEAADTATAEVTPTQVEDSTSGDSAPGPAIAADLIIQVDTGRKVLGQPLSA